jgi:hypothetical protein
MKLDSFYDYSKVVFVNFNTPITIICPIHGEFKQTPNNHRMGQGCPYCSGNIIFNPKTKEEISKYCIKHKIRSGAAWYKHWKDNNLQEQGYSSVPWRLYKIDQVKWTEYVWGKKKTKEEIKNYWIKHKIRSGRVWLKHWKDNNLQEQGYSSVPCSSYKMTDAEWSEYVWGKKKTKEEIKEYCIKHKIRSGGAWYKHWKDNNLQEQGYPSVPWRLYKIDQVKWTEYVWGKKR